MEIVMEPISPENIEVKLENKDLWDKFNTLGTEMIITKIGRRMFPFLKVSIQGLNPDESYMVILDMVKVSDRRYKFNERENHWQIGAYRSLSLSPTGMFVHPDCPIRGSGSIHCLMFNKVKLTNNSHAASFGHILLESMGRYVPRVSIITYQNFLYQSWQNSLSFTFEETEFIAVTAYMNREIIKLKIDNNPFARAFKGTGLKWKAVEGYSESKYSNRIFFDKDTETSEERTESPIAMTYLASQVESVDDIQVLHVNPSSIIVTDVPPSSSPSCLIRGSYPVPPRKMAKDSEVNIVFESIENRATSTESLEKVSLTGRYESEQTLQSLLYPRTSLQNITVVQNKDREIEIVLNEETSLEDKSAHGWTKGIIGDSEGEIICKVTDVRSIREAPFPSEEQGNERTTRLSKCGDNEVCLSEGIESLIKLETNRDKLDDIDLGDSCHRCRTSQDFSTKLSRDNTNKRKISEVRNDSSSQETMTDKGQHLEGSMLSWREDVARNVDSDNTEEITEGSSKTSNKDDETPGSVRSDILKDSTGECTRASGVPVSQSSVQISRLLHFVNSVSLSVVNSSNDKTLSSPHTDLNNNRILSERSTLPAQKRPVDDRLISHPKRAKLMSQPDDTLECKDQSSDWSKALGQLKKVYVTKHMLRNSALPQSDFRSIPPQNHVKKGFSIERSTCTSQTESIPNQNKITYHEAAKEQPESKSTKEITKTGGHDGQVKRLVSSELTKSHPQNSTNCTGSLQKLTEGQHEVCTSQGMKKVNIPGNEELSCGETTTTKIQVVAKENGAPAENVDSRKLPVILSSYSIHPSKFPKQQVIELIDESKVNGNKSFTVCSAENTSLKSNKVNKALEKSYRDQPINQGMLIGKKSEVNGIDVHNDQSKFPEKNHSKYKKIAPRTRYPPSAPDVYIDLNMSTYGTCNRYQGLANNVSHHVNKGIPLQVVYTFETTVSQSRAPDPRLPEIYNPTRTTFTGYASNLISSTLPIITAGRGLPRVSGK